MKKHFITSLMALGIFVFSACGPQDSNDRNGPNMNTTGTGSGTGLNSDYDNNSTTGAIDPGQEQFEKQNQSHHKGASTSGDDSSNNSTSNTGTRVGPTGGEHSTGSPATTGRTTRSAGEPGLHNTTGNGQGTTGAATTR